MREFLTKLLSYDFMGHGYCYLWRPEIVWLHVTSDMLITLSYYTIPLALFNFVRKRRDLPFHWMFLMFGVFIFGSGTTYRLAGLIKGITAASSVVTAAVLIPLIPRALALPSPPQLRAANLDLQREVRERRRVGSALHKAYEEVESTVRERTADLARTNEQLQTEIIERKRAEEKLRRSEEFLIEGQRLSHTGSWVWRVSSGDLTFSRETFRILGFDPKQPAPSFQAALERFHPDDRAFMDSVLDAAIRERRNYEFEARLAMPDGSAKQVHSVGHIALDESGNTEFVGTLMDVTERRREEVSLQMAQAQLAHIARVTTMGELAASMAHEINQPLAAVVTNGNACLRWMGATPPNLEEARAAVTRIVKEGARASEVIGRIRRMMKKSGPQMATLDVNELIQEILTLTRNQILRHGVSPRTDLAEGLTAVKGDAVQLQQVVLNLVMNGIEATSARSEGPREIVLKSENQEPNRIVISVCDSGGGIDPATTDQIFNPFGGKLWAESNGVGATFRFSLPAVLAVAT